MHNTATIGAYVLRKLAGMIFRLSAGLLIAFMLAGVMVNMSGSAIAAPDYDGAKKFIEALYAPYKINDGDGLNYQGREQEFFTPELAALIVKDREETEPGSVGRIDFDIFIFAQDWGNLTTKVRLGADGKEVQQADVTVTNLGDSKHVYYGLVRSTSGWRIADIRWEGMRLSLRDVLSRPDDAKDPSLESPKAFLEDIYRHYTARENVPFEYMDGENGKLYFTQSVIDLMHAFERANPDPPGFDMDVFLGGQEWVKFTTSISTKDTGPNTAIGTVVLDEEVDGKRTFTFNLARGKEGWRISDIRWGQGDSLVETLNKRM